MLNFTSAALSSRPLWNFTPRRSLKVHVRPSDPTCHESASEGFGNPCSLYRVRKLNRPIQAFRLLRRPL